MRKGKMKHTKPLHECKSGETRAASVPKLKQQKGWNVLMRTAQHMQPHPEPSKSKCKRSKKHKAQDEGEVGSETHSKL